MLRIAIFCVAILAGAAAAWMAYTRISAPQPQVVQPAPQPEPEPEPQREILVAATDIDLGAELTADNLAWRTWPADNVLEAYVVRRTDQEARSDMTGRRARGRFIAGEPILQGKLLDSGTGFLAALLETGERAVAVPVSAENTAGGFVLPGDRVDVIFTGPGQGSAGIVSRTILENVEVLAIDQTPVDQTGDAEAVVGRTATLRVQDDQARRLANAKTQGDLSLALRASADRDAPTTQPEVSPQPSGTTVQVRRGGSVETVTLQ